ncbi:MAG: trigger factor [Clostridia bacterium]|nr:trigger factor [Clostridia bacterium]
MTLNKVERNGNTVEMEFAIDRAEFDKAIEKSYKKNVGKIYVPGFRKGKAPRRMIEKMYGEGVFYEDAINFVYPDMYDEAVKEAKIEPVDQPEADVVDVGEAGLVMKATVTVKPEVKIGEYKGLKLTRAVYTVTDEEVEEEVKKLAEQNSRLVTVEDRESKKGDTAVIDFEGFIDGKSFAGGAAKSFNLEIGSDMFIPGFEDQLIGHKAGEEFDVTVSFPEDYHMKDFAGKEAVFKVTLNEVKEKIVPEINDEFAQEVSEHDTIDEVRAELKAKLLEMRVKNANDMLEGEIISKLVDTLDADIPSVMIANEFEQVQKEQNQQFMEQGMTMDQYFQMSGQDPQEFVQLMMNQAERRVKSRLALEKVAEIENIEVSDADLDMEIERIAKRFEMEPDQIRNVVPLDTVREELKTQLAVEHIKGLSEITEMPGEEYEKMKKEEFEAKQAEEAMKKAAEELKEKAETAKEPEIIHVTKDDETPAEENK